MAHEETLEDRLPLDVMIDRILQNWLEPMPTANLLGHYSFSRFNYQRQRARDLLAAFKADRAEIWSDPRWRQRALTEPRPFVVSQQYEDDTKHAQEVVRRKTQHEIDRRGFDKPTSEDRQAADAVLRQHR